MSDDALGRLQDLASRAKAALAASDAAALNEVVGQARTIGNDASLPASRALGVALLDIATTLAPAGATAQVEGVYDVFDAANRALRAAGDAHIDDFLVLWHNLGALYESHQAFAQRDQVLQAIVHVAQTYDGPLEKRGADVFLEQALMYRRLGRTEPMLAMWRQVHRFRTAEGQPPADRVSWLELYGELLLQAGRTDEAAAVIAQGIELAHQLGDAEREARGLNISASISHSRGDNASALAALERARRVIEAPALAETQFAAAVLHNLVAALLRLGDASRYPEALALAERTIAILQRLGLAEGDDFAFALYQRAVLVEYLGDWPGAARGYVEAAAVPGAQPANAAEWLSLAGRAWFEAGEFDRASDCYLDAVRRRISSPAAT